MPPPNHRKAASMPLGEARQSQVLQLYGPGAMVDLPDYALLIGGLDFWNERGCDPIHEPRLLNLVRQATGVARVDLRTPPKEVDPLKTISGSISPTSGSESTMALKRRMLVCSLMTFVGSNFVTSTSCFRISKAIFAVLMLPPDFFQ